MSQSANPPIDPRAEWESGSPPLCGLFVGADGQARLATAEADGPRAVSESLFHPFAWVNETALPDPATARVERLAGDGQLTHLAHFADVAAYRAWLDQRPRNTDSETLRALESQLLLQRGARMFAGLTFAHLRRVQLDIETACGEPGGFSNANRAADRVLAIGLGTARGPRLLEISALTHDAERALLEELNRVLAEEDPDVIEGHNIFKFDLDYLRTRCRRHHVPCAWGRFGQEATFRPSSLRVAERQLDFPRCDLPGRAVFDTYLMVQLYDLAARELPSWPQGRRPASRPDQGGRRPHLPRPRGHSGKFCERPRKVPGLFTRRFARDPRPRRPPFAGLRRAGENFSAHFAGRLPARLGLQG